MKKLYTLCCVVLAMGLLGTAILIYLSPEIVPVHYNFAGEVDRYGSKYENLLWPFFAILIGGFLMLIAKTVGRKQSEKDEKVILYVALATLVFFMILGFFFMIKSMRYDSSAPVEMSMDILKTLGFGLGGMQIVLGILIPKTKLNSYIGLRTKWSMANDNVWAQSQRFCGKVSIICGILMIAMAVLMPSIWGFVALTVLLVVWAILSIGGSYYFYKKDKEK